MIMTSQAAGAASAQGIDVSNFQGAYDWAGAVKSVPQLAFGIYRLTQGLGGQGTNSPDPDAVHNHAAISSAGLIRGAYHFLNPSQDGAAQARYHVDQWDKMGITGRDMIWLDNETPTGGPARVAACAQAFMHELASLLPHNPAGVYSNLSFAQDGYCAGLGHWPWWAAHPGTAVTAPPVWAAWKFWQWGTRSGVDADAFNGTRTQLLDWIGSFAPAPRPAKSSGPPYLQIADGHSTLGQIADRRATTLYKLLAQAAGHYTAGDYAHLSSQVLPAGTRYYTENP